jgi:lipopolysaccharide exporter
MPRPASRPLPPQNRPRLLHALGWNTLGGMLSAGSSFVLGVILGRVLGPGPFGLVAATMLPISLGQLFVDQGVSAELIQKPVLTSKDLRRARVRQVMVGVVFSASFALGAPVMVRWYHLPEIRSVALALSPLFLIQALAQVPMALLKRHLRFRLLQAVQVGSYLSGYLCLGLPMALSGFGVWSLVAAQTVQVVLQTTILFAISPKAQDHFSTENAPVLRIESAFAWRVMATNLANWSQSNLIGILIGRNFGTTDLGLFNRAQNLVQTPLGILTTSLQGVLFPAAAIAQNDISALRQTFLRASRSLAWIAFPVAGFGIVWSSPIVEGIYGSAWTGAAVFLPPLFLALPFVALMSLTGPVLLGIGIASAEFKIQGVLGLATLAILFGVAGHGVLWMVWALTMLQVLRWAWMTSALLPLISLPAAMLLYALLPPLAAGAAAGFAGWMVDWLLQRNSVGTPLRLAAEAGCAMVCALVAVITLRRRMRTV